MDIWSSHRRHSEPLVLESLEDRDLLSGGYGLINLVSDIPGLAQATNPGLVGAWGLSFSHTGPFWLADSGAGNSLLLDGRGQPVPLEVTIPSVAGLTGAPTGTVLNVGSGFVLTENGRSAPGIFLFATLDGTISGWAPLLDSTQAFLAVNHSSTGASYTGLALATAPTGQSFLYAADYSRGTIDVFDQDFQPVLGPGSFQDPNLPAGLAPFNIQALGGRLFVTYAPEYFASQTAGGSRGYLDVFDTAGNLISSIDSPGAFDAPWGLALAPADFGTFGGDLLVGNNGDGHISAFDPRSGAFLGQLANASGQPIALPGLWALAFGNGHAGGDPDTLFFTAGLDYGMHGLFGAIQPPQRIGLDTAGLGLFDPNAPGEPPNYPLPPFGGPTLSTSSVEPVPPTAVLLPLAEFSLALAPTLSSLPQPGPQPAAPALPGSVVAASWNGASPVAFLTTGTTLLMSGAAGTDTAAGSPGSLANSRSSSLNSFLDLTPLPALALREERGQPVQGSLVTAGTASSPVNEMPALEPAQGSEADKLLVWFSSESDAPVKGKEARQQEILAGPEQASWTDRLRVLLQVASFPAALLVYWHRHRSRSSQKAQPVLKTRIVSYLAGQPPYGS